MSTTCQVRVTGPLARYADGFRADLAAQGYAAESADRNLRTLAHVSRWMADRGLSAGQLSIARLEEFLRARRQGGYHHALSIRAVMPLVGYLRRAGVAAVPPEPAADGILKVVADQYCGYLVSERAVTTPVAGKYGGLAREFLAACAQPGGPGLAGLSAAWVTGYVVAQCRDRSPGSAKFVVTALRSLLRYLFLAGHTRCQLASAVPAVAHWGAGSLPRALSAQTVTALLASCDESTLPGRDRAILALLARLGLRAGEVAGLELDDLDWAAGEISVRGKGSRQERLPLPADVGEALAAYLHGSRPPAGCRKVFLRLNAPVTGLTAPAVTAVVYHACARAGLPKAGAHRLRHSAASAMLAGGATLTEIGQVLRHARLETTAIYAKIDHAALRGLARPWPGGAA